MAQTIVIDPITRIEGHAKVTIHLDDAGQVADARFHVTEFRGFEKFCVGRSFAEMPGITARICGICPVSHLMASAKAGDAILGVRIPPAAEKLRRLMNLGQIVQSHALSFFHLSAPDLLLGMDSAPAQRNIMGLIQKNPEVARQGIRLRRFGQEVIRILGGKSIHPAWTVPGGVREPLSAASHAEIKAMLPEALEIAQVGLNIYHKYAQESADEVAAFGDFPSLYMGLVTPSGGLEHYDGFLRIVDSEGKVLQAGLDPMRYDEFIGEAVEPWTYLKFPYYKPLVSELDRYADGMYRVGPLARLNVCDFAGTPRADEELARFRTLSPNGRVVNSGFHYHYARLIEILFALERIEEMLADPGILDDHVRSRARVNQQIGIGVSEAPRGTLVHEYHVNDDGILQNVNLIIATGQNNLAMNRTVGEIARRHMHGQKLEEGILNRIEHGIRLFDPCLSCSTHALGKMPLHVQVMDRHGSILDEVARG